MTGETAKRHIRNAEVRYANATDRYREHAENRLMSTQLQRRAQGNRGNRRMGGMNTPGSENTRGSQFSSLEPEAIDRKYAQYDETYEEGDLEAVIENRPEKPPFPIFIFGLALCKDILDVPADISVIGIFLASALSFLISIILFIWVLGKLSGGWWKKRMIKWLWARYVMVILIEFIPLVHIIPATTIFILMAHHREKKIVQMFDSFLEDLHSGKIRLPL